VRAAAGLRVEALDLDHPDAPVGHRRPGFERAQQIGARTELIFRDVIRPHRAVAGEHRVHLAFELRAQRRGQPFQLEVDARLVDADLDAGDPAAVVAQRDRVEHVEHRVVASERQAPRAAHGERRALTDERR